MYLTERENDPAIMAHNFIHPSVCIDKGVQIGLENHIWHNTHIQSGAVIGNDNSIGQNCYIAGVIGNDNKIQNNVSIYKGVSIYSRVFVGPSVVFTNVKIPVFPYNVGSENYSNTFIESDVVLGANCTILPGIHIQYKAFVGAGAVVTKNVYSGQIVIGNPAKQIKRRWINSICEWIKYNKHKLY